MVAEPSIQAKLPEGIALAGEQYLDITQGSSRVGLLFESQTEKPITIKERTILCQLVIGNLVPKLVAPKYDISVLDRHFLEEDILTELDKEEEGYSPDEPMDYHEFKKTAENITSASFSSGQKSAQMPTISCTTAKRMRHLLKSNLKKMAVGSLIKLIFLAQKNLVKTSTRKLRLCSLNIKTPSAKLIWI